MRKTHISLAPEIHRENPVVSLGFGKDETLIEKDNNEADLCFINGKYPRIKNPYSEKHKEVEALAGQEGFLPAEYFTHEVTLVLKNRCIQYPFGMKKKTINPAKSDNFMRIFTSYKQA